MEPATDDQLRAHESLMLEADKNEEVTANDPLSQQLGMVPPETPKLIVRFVRHGCASDKRSCNPGEVWPVEKELALRHLLDKKPVVELASPEELKRDRDLVDQIEDRRKRWNQLRVRKEDPLVLVVRFVKPGKNSHGNSCNPGEVWEVDEEFAYSNCRGRSPVCELATEAELKAYRNKLTMTVAPVEGKPPEDIDRLWRGDKSLSTPEESAPQGSPQGLLSKCSPCELKAYGQYLKAKESDPQIVTDQDAYEWIENRPEDGEKLPPFDTWVRYVRKARKAAGTQKNKPRGNRSGRSVMRSEDT